MDAESFATGVFAFLLLLGFGNLLISMSSRNGDTRAFQRKLFSTAFGIRFLCSLLLYGTFLYSRVIRGGDDSGWFKGLVVQNMLDEPGNGIFAIPELCLTAVNGINRGYATILGIYFYFTRLGSQPSAAALNSFCGALTCVFTYRVARALFSEASAIRAAWWLCWFPSMILWSALTLKEPIVILLELLALYGCLRLRIDRLSIKYLGVCIGCFLVLLSLRFYAAYMVAASIMISLAMPQLGRRRITPVSAILLGLGFLFVLRMLSGSLESHQEFFNTIDLQGAAKFRHDVSHGNDGTGSAVFLDVEADTMHGVGLTMLVGALHLLLAPFPWQFGGGSILMLMTAPEMMFWWFFFFRGIIPGAAMAVRTRLGDVLPLLLFLVSLGFVYSIMFGNVGLIYRQRAQLLPYLVSIGAWGLEQRALKRSVARLTPGLAGPPLAYGSAQWASPQPDPRGTGEVLWAPSKPIP